MPKLEDILADKKSFPDEQTIQLADGVTATLGELRGGYLRQADYTKKTTEVSRRGEELDRSYQDKMSALQTAEARLMELAKTVVGPKAEPTRDEVAELVHNDPVAGRLMNEINSLKSSLGQVGGYLKTLEERRQADGMAQLEAQHRAVIAHLQKEDPELDVPALVKYAQEHYTPRLDIAYAAMTREAAIEKAKKAAVEEGIQKGYEKAKVELNSPQIPLRRAGIRPENAPKNMDEALERAYADPEVMNPLFGMKP